jgi:NAD(P)-dependent dehydrogenase (short-subunit alcohol dehydrogenase family)
MLNEKVIIVTGGAGLLGTVFCESIIKSNGIVIIADLNEESGKITEAYLNKKFGIQKSIFVKLEITSANSIQNLINTVITKYNKIDAIVNNAYPKNKNYGRHFFDVEFDDFCSNLNSHLGGYFLVSQLFAKHFKLQGHGNIINIASIYGVIAPKFEIYNDTHMTVPIEYAVIKSAIIHMTKYLAEYLKGCNIRVNSISPGGILDKQPEQFIESYKKNCLSKGMLDKEDIVGTLLFLLSENSKYINGQNLIVDDGFTL